MNTESLLPPMREWIMRKRLSARFYQLIQQPTNGTKP